MAYNNDIPKPDDLISSSQGQIKDNFAAIDSSVFGFARNHVTLTDSTSGGLHKEVDFFSAIADPTLGAFVASLYAKTIAPANTIELVYKNAAFVRQLTNLTLIDNTSMATGFGIVTPWGITLNWGNLSVSSGGPTVANPLKFQSAFPGSCDAIICTATGSDATKANVTVNGVSKTGCNIYCNTTTNIGVYFLAIGH